MRSFAERLRERLPRDCPGRLGFAAWHLDEKEPVLIGDSRPVDAASTIKILVMITALRAVQDATLRWASALPLPEPGERTGGTGVLRELRGIRSMELVDLITLMIVVSDNVATNTVIDAVGRAAVTDTAASLGCPDTQLQRHFNDTTAQVAGLDNVTTAEDQARILAALASGEALNPDSTRYALDVLARQQLRDRLPAYLPWGASCWNKTGEESCLRHDVGLVGTGETPEAVVAVLVDDLTDARSLGIRGGPAVDYIARCGEAVHSALLST